METNKNPSVRKPFITPRRSPPRSSFIKDLSKSKLRSPVFEWDEEKQKKKFEYSEGDIITVFDKIQIKMASMNLSFSKISKILSSKVCFFVWKMLSVDSSKVLVFIIDQLSSNAKSLRKKKSTKSSLKGLQFKTHKVLVCNIGLRALKYLVWNKVREKEVILLLLEVIDYQKFLSRFFNFDIQDKSEINKYQKFCETKFEKTMEKLGVYFDMKNCTPVFQDFQMNCQNFSFVHHFSHTQYMYNPEERMLFFFKNKYDKFFFRISKHQNIELDKFLEWKYPMKLDESLLNERNIKIKAKVAKHLLVISTEADFTVKACKAFLFLVRFLNKLPEANCIYNHKIFSLAAWRVILFLMNTQRINIALVVIQTFIDKILFFMKSDLFLIYDTIVYMETNFQMSETDENYLKKLRMHPTFDSYQKNTRFYNFKYFGDTISSKSLMDNLALTVSELEKLKLKTHVSIYQCKIFLMIHALKHYVKELRRPEPELIYIANLCHLLFQSAYSSLNIFFKILKRRKNRDLLKIVRYIFEILGIDHLQLQNQYSNVINPLDLEKLKDFVQFKETTIELLNDDFYDQKINSELFEYFFLNELSMEDIDKALQKINMKVPQPMALIRDFTELIYYFTDDAQKIELAQFRKFFYLVIEKALHFSLFYVPVGFYYIFKNHSEQKIKVFAKEIEKIIIDQKNSFKMVTILSLNAVGVYLSSYNNTVHAAAKSNFNVFKENVDLQKIWNLLFELGLNHKLVYEIERYYNQKDEPVSYENMKLYIKAFKQINEDMKNVETKFVLANIFGESISKETDGTTRKCLDDKDAILIKKYHKNRMFVQISDLQHIVTKICKDIEICSFMKRKQMKLIYMLIDVFCACMFTETKNNKLEPVLYSIVYNMFQAIESELFMAFKMNMNFQDINANIFITINRFYFNRKICNLIYKRKIDQLESLFGKAILNVDKSFSNLKDKKSILQSLNYLLYFIKFETPDLFLKSTLVLSKLYRKQKKFNKSRRVLSKFTEVYTQKHFTTNPDFIIEKAKVDLALGEYSEAISNANNIIKNHSNHTYQVKAMKIIVRNMRELRVRQKIKSFYDDSSIRSLIDSNEDLLFQKVCFMEEQSYGAVNELSVIIKLWISVSLLGNKYIMQTIPKIINTCDKIIEAAKDNSKSRKINLNYLNNVQAYLSEFVNSVPPYKLLIHLQMFIARLLDEEALISDFLQACLIKVINAYPEESVWWFMGILLFEHPARGKKFEKAKSIMNGLEKPVSNYYKNVEEFFVQLIKLACIKKEFTKIPSEFSLLTHTNNLKILMPLRYCLCPKFPGKHETDDFNPYQNQKIYVKRVLENVNVMLSKEQPIKITIEGSNNKLYHFILKYERGSDVRKESRTINFIEYLNFLFQNDEETRTMNFNMQIFTISSLTSNINLIEWVENSRTLKSIFDIKGVNPSDFNRYLPDRKEGLYRDGIFDDPKMPKFVIKDYLFNISQNENIWYKKFISFIKSWVVWSVFCYIIRLGDRHYQNILFLDDTAEIVHIDFDCIFDRAKLLAFPETVDFRLTSNVLKALGITSCWSLFHYYFKKLIKVCEKNIDNIIANLEVFVIDPLMDVPKPKKNSELSAMGLDPEKLARKQKIMDQQQQLKEIRNEVMQLCKIDLNESITYILRRNQSRSNLQKMYYGWLPHI